MSVGSHTFSFTFIRWYAVRSRSRDTTLNCIRYDRWQSWDAYFRSNSYTSPPSLAVNQRGHVPVSQVVPFVGGGSPVATLQPDEKTIDDHLAVQAIIRSYQVI